MIPGVAVRWLPSCGFVVLGKDDMRILSTPPVVAMRTMTPCRVAWMASVCRGVFGYAQGRISRILQTRR